MQNQLHYFFQHNRKRKIESRNRGLENNDAHGT